MTILNKLLDILKILTIRNKDIFLEEGSGKLLKYWRGQNRLWPPLQNYWGGGGGGLPPPLAPLFLRH